MSEPLNFPRLESICWRALCRHQVTEREMVMASTIIRLSFVIGEPSLRIGAAIELAHLTGFSKGNSHGTVQKLVRARSLEVSPDKRVYTFLPPSHSWPWLWAPRVDGAMADEIEAGLIWANKGGPVQPELFAPGADREFAEALSIERMRSALLEYHQAACSAGGRQGATEGKAEHFPVKDGDSKFPRGAGESLPPLGTGSVMDGRGPVAFARGEEGYYWHPGGPGRPGDADSTGVDAISREGFPNREPVPKSGTCHLNALSVLVSSVPGGVQNTEALSALNGGFPNRELASPGLMASPPATGPVGQGHAGDMITWRTPLGPEAKEDEVLRWLRAVLGLPAMEQWGGYWRNALRECPRAVHEAIGNFKLRIQQRGFPNFPGGWLKDQHRRFRNVFITSLQKRI